MTTVDAHHHIWRQADVPWLQGPMVPRIFGPYEALRRDYPIEEFLADLANSGIEKSVYVQLNWAKNRAVDEVAWVQSVADNYGWPHATTISSSLTISFSTPRKATPTLRRKAIGAGPTIAWTRCAR